MDDALAADTTRPGRIHRALAVLNTADEASAPGVLPTSAHDAALLTWDELRARDIWEQLPAWDQAFVHRMISRTVAVYDTSPSRVAAATALAAAVDVVRELWAPGSPGVLTGGHSAQELHARLCALPVPWQAHVLGGQRAPKYAVDLPRLDVSSAVHDAVAKAAAGQTPPPATPTWQGGWNTREDRDLGERLADRLVRLPYGWQVDALRSISTGATALAAVADAGQAINMLREHGIHLAWNASAEPHPTALRPPEKTR